MKLISKLSILLLMVLFIACSDSSSDPEGTAEVAIYSELSGQSVSVNIKSGKDKILDQTVDSIHVSKFRILISRILMHKEQSTEEDNHMLKEGPFVLIGDVPGNSVKLTEGAVPVGNFDKIKFEVHRFSSSQAGEYESDPVFGDFATNERYSVIIEGTLFQDGNPEEFTYNGTVTANLNLKFATAITLTEDTKTELVLQIDPAIVFKDNDVVLDPRDSKNENDIDNNIKEAIKALKK